MIQEIIKQNHFTLLRRREIPEVEGTLWEMAHEKAVHSSAGSSGQTKI